MQNIKERQEFENYNKIKLLGEGSFGKAFLVERASDKVTISSNFNDRKYELFCS